MTDLPRATLAHLPTPLEPMHRLAGVLGLPEGALWIKHDDLTGVAGGGNKVRKLEYLAGAALADGADTLVTGGGRQSNHVRLTAAVANRLGLAATVVLASEPPDRPTGNVVLDELLAPDFVWAGNLGYYDLEAAIEATAAELADAGRRPYAIPVGGASAVGALGYVAAADELRGQLVERGAAADQAVVFVADGSGGTHAGLVAGFGDHARVVGVDVGTRPDLDDAVPLMAAATATLAGREVPVGTVHVDHDCIGAGYGAPSDACREALDLIARAEGVLLDPVYTGKGLAGLVAAVRDGRIDGSSPTVFLHTGGLPALFSPATPTGFGSARLPDRGVRARVRSGAAGTGLQRLTRCNESYGPDLVLKVNSQVPTNGGERPPFRGEHRMSDTSVALPIADERTRRIFGDLAFSSAKRGFDPAEVTAFLVNASGAVERMLTRLKDAEQRAESAESRLLEARTPEPSAVPPPVAGTENSALLDRTLVLAEKTAVAAVSDARTRAQAILTQAQEQAREYFATERAAIASEWDRVQVEQSQLETLRLAVAAETMALEGVRSHLRSRIAAAATELAGIAEDPDLLNYAINRKPGEVEVPQVAAPAATLAEALPPAPDSLADTAIAAPPEAPLPATRPVEAINASSVSSPEKSFGAKWADNKHDDAEEEAFDRFFSADVEPEPTQQWILAG